MHKLISLFILSLLLTGCWSNPTEPAPAIIISDEISYDYGIKNSGVFCSSEDGKGFLVSRNFVKRYNLLVDKYSSFINIANTKEKLIYKDAGIIKLTNWLYYIDNQHFSYFLYLNLIHKQNLHNLYGETKKD